MEIPTTEAINGLRFRYISMMKKTLTAWVLAALCLVSCGVDKNIRKGEKFLQLGEYYDAAAQFKTAYQRTPPKDRDKRGQLSAKMAHCYDRINSSERAVAALRNVIRYHQDDGETHLMLARNLMKSGRYAEAETEFRAALDSMPDHPLATQGLKAAQDAPRIKELGSKYTVKRMEIFNSRRADYSPMLFGDEFDQLFFSSTRNEAQGDELSGITGTKNADIFVSEKDEKGRWQRPRTIDSGLNSDFDEATPAFSVDGREMYLTQCPTDPSYPRYAQIAVSKRSDAAWGKPTKLEISRDTLSSFAHPATLARRQLALLRQRHARRQGWPRHLARAHHGRRPRRRGEPRRAHQHPWRRDVSHLPPQRRPLFLLQRPPRTGSLDIFIAKVGKDRRYHLEHPGYPLNSQGDDFGMTFEGPHNRGFFSSNRGDGRGWDHIYSFELPEVVQTVKGWVYEMDGYELPAAEVFMVGDDGTNLKLSVKGDGSFEQVVDPGVNYIMLATCKGYLNHRVELHVDSVDQSEEYTLQFPLPSIRVPVLIDNIFYDFDKATLRPESKTALDDLVKLLNENPNVTIELSAHTDYKGRAEYNKRLSQRRAESVVAYLTEHGIARDRLTPVGYGKEKPKTVRKKMLERYPWLKEGDVLTEEFIKKLDKDKQEICNQINRRTEFIVLRTTYGMFDEKGNLKTMPTPKQEETGDDDDLILIE